MLDAVLNPLTRVMDNNVYTAGTYTFHHNVICLDQIVNMGPPKGSLSWLNTVVIISDHYVLLISLKWRTYKQHNSEIPAFQK